MLMYLLGYLSLNAMFYDYQNQFNRLEGCKDFPHQGRFFNSTFQKTQNVRQFFKNKKTVRLDY